MVRAPTGATINGSGGVCVGGSSWFSVNITGGAWPYTLNYTVNGTPQTFAGYTSGTHIDLGVLAVNTYTIIVTSITDNCSTPVPGLPKSYVINVNPIPALSSSLTPPAICSGTAFSYTPTSLTAGTTFSWTRATVAGITPVGPTSGNGNPNETLTNTTAAPIVVTYVYTLTANGCSNTQNVTVTVNPRPTLSSSLYSTGYLQRYGIQLHADESHSRHDVQLDTGNGSGHHTCRSRPQATAILTRR